MTAFDLSHLMLTVAVEGGKLHNGLAAKRSPVEDLLLRTMTDDESTAFMLAWQTNNETSELGHASRCVNVGFKVSGGPSVDVQLIQLGVNAAKTRVRTFAVCNDR